MQVTEQPTPSRHGGQLPPLAENPQSTAKLFRQPSTRACAMCVKAKAKCTPHAEFESICQRCHRLKKQCFLDERPSRKRTRKSKPTRVAQLEQKLDGLFNLLTPNQTGSQMTPLSQASDVLYPRSPVSLDSNASTAGPSIAAPQSINPDGEISAPKNLNCSLAPVDHLSTAPAGKLSVARTAPSQLEPDQREADLWLLEFKTNLAEQFPFVVLHPQSTSQSLHHERPLLWKAVMVASSHRNSDRQMALGANLMEDLTMRLLFRAEKSLDLLQALLVLIAWYHYHTLVNPQVTNLLHLAKALINTMAFNRTQTAYDRGMFFLDGHDLTKSGTQSSQGSESSKSDGWRALAGCFYLTTVISGSFRSLEPQFNTPYILECCQKLEQAGEYQSDALLVQLVRLQEIRYRMGRSFPYDESVVPRRPDVPVDMFISAWQKELETFWVSLPAASQQNWLLLATYHSTEIAQYEIDMSDSLRCLPRAAIKVVDRTGRLEFIYASLLATRKVFDVYSSVPVGKISGICFTLWAQFHHALMNAVKLLSSEAYGWDVQHARSVLGFPDFLHSQVKAIEEVISRRGLVLENAMDGKDVFTRFLNKIHQVLRWFESSRVSRIEAHGLSDQPTNPNGSLEVTDTGGSLPILDDAFWQTLFDDNWMLVGDGLGT